MSLLIQHGRVITAQDDYIADVFIEGASVSAIGQQLPVRADRVINAEGKYLLPGCIDPHVHFAGEYFNTTVSDDFTTGTAAALCGGTTTVIDFAMQTRGESFLATLDKWHDKLQGKALADVGFHLAITDLAGGGSPDALARIVDEGVTSFKLFMAYPDAFMVDDATLLRVMQIASGAGAVVMVHAENGAVIEVLREGVPEYSRPDLRQHALTRPPALEQEATFRAIQLARIADCRLYVVHVSCEEAASTISDARRAGSQVWGETCTQYLVTDEECLALPDFEGAKYVFTPPPRSKHHQEILWSAASHGNLSVIATDHAPYNWEGQKSLGRDDFAKVPSGAPGVEERLPMIHHFGVQQGRLSLKRMVALLATNPAVLFGLFPRKGTIAPGSDADIVIFDPNRRITISSRTHHSACDYSLYEGVEVAGAPDTVIVRGTVAVESGTLHVDPGFGRFVERARMTEEIVL